MYIVEVKKTVVIITDGTLSIRNMADQIAAVLEGYCRVILLAAPDFNGSDILPADVIFLGCMGPQPSAFTYLEEMFRHINFAGRSCGIFSSGAMSGKAIHYLKDMVRDSELALAKPFTGTAAELQGWIKEILP